MATDLRGDRAVTTDLYDVEDALRVLAQNRRRNDKATSAQVDIADRLAINLTKHFPEGLEDAGRALVIAGASVAALALAAEGIDSMIICNVIAFAGQRMVLDARAAQTYGGTEQ